jgi:hypothetical protein
VTLDEITSHFESSQSRIPIDVRLAAEFPGYVRSVYVAQGLFAVIEFEQYGFDEGGAYFFGGYSDYASLVRSLEEYLQRPLREWLPLAPKDYPPKPDGAAADTRTGSARLESAIASGAVPLPARTDFELRGSSYWGRCLKEHYRGPAHEGRS